MQHRKYLVGTGLTALAALSGCTASASPPPRKVMFQVPAGDEDWCRNCGEPADAIIERHQMEAFFLFGHPLKTYERSTNPAVECEHYSPNAVTTELSERERRNILG